MPEASQIRDSKVVAEAVAHAAHPTYYLETFKARPTKIIVGIWDSAIEVARWLLWPRFRLGAGLLTRIDLLRKFIRAELNIPGGTTCLEAIWLTYSASLAKSPAETWVEV